MKDSIDTADKMMTTAGSLAIVGKSNMSEWGYMRSVRGYSGWSSRGGQVRNSYVLDRSPSGSSSGSAVAVAANLFTLAIGVAVLQDTAGPMARSVSSPPASTR